MHDGVSPHFSVAGRQYLASYGNNWVERRGPHAWPPRSLDFNPVDYSVWGRLKDKYRIRMFNVNLFLNMV